MKYLYSVTLKYILLPCTLNDLLSIHNCKTSSINHLENTNINSWTHTEIVNVNTFPYTMMEKKLHLLISTTISSEKLLSMWIPSRLMAAITNSPKFKFLFESLFKSSSFLSSTNTVNYFP